MPKHPRAQSRSATPRRRFVPCDAYSSCVGDAFDNALAESMIGLFKTELIKPGGPWKTVEQVEIATLEYIDWFNHRRLFETCGDIPPVELEAARTTVNTPPSPRPAIQPRRSPDKPGRFIIRSDLYLIRLIGF
ncbi:hypothetical protein GCM10009610_30260 [Pseudonocardia xinjiangensis]